MTIVVHPCISVLDIIVGAPTNRVVGEVGVSIINTWSIGPRRAYSAHLFCRSSAVFTVKGLQASLVSPSRYKYTRSGSKPVTRT